MLNLAYYRNSLARSTKSTRSHIKSAPTDCKHRVSGSISLPSRGAFHLSFTVLYAIGHQVVFRLGGWSPLFPTGFQVSGGTLDTVCSVCFSPTGLSPSMAGLPRPFVYRCLPMSPSATPMILLPQVWPLPISLATTFGISVDYFSSPYLDVSVQAVPFIYLLIQYMIHEHDFVWIAPFRYLRM